MRLFRSTVFLFSAFGLVLEVGCREAPPRIKTFTVKKESPDRMLGGIVLRGDKAWFFKITAQRVELDAKQPEIEAFLQSLKFGDGDERPEWTLPAEWETDPTERPARIATLKVPVGSEKAELSITALPKPPQQSPADYLLANINRWRDQLGQSPASAEEVAELRTLAAKNAEVLFISISGKQKASSGMSAPFAS